MTLIQTAAILNAVGLSGNLSSSLVFVMYKNKSVLKFLIHPSIFRVTDSPSSKKKNEYLDVSLSMCLSVTRPSLFSLETVAFNK